MTFAYANSDHVDSTPPAEAPAVSAPAVAGVFSYPKSVHASSPAPAAPPARPSEPAPLTYPSMEQPAELPTLDLPAEIRALREADPDRAMYSPQRTYADVVKDYAGATDTERAVLAEAREWFADFALDHQEAKSVAETFNAELASGIPSDETVAAWGREATQETFRQYGRDAEARLADARLLVRRDPRVRQVLERSGMGSHPRVVQLLIEKARSERNRGRLR
jgi:hypothetical protein